MSRYFYTDPLAAGWMAKHFGMSFQTESGIELVFQQGMSGRHWFSRIDDIGHDYYGQFHIYNGSKTMLEPQIGDLVHYTAYDYTTQPHLQDNREYYRLLTSDLPDDASEAVIIQRDGKPFFWPEQQS